MRKLRNFFRNFVAEMWIALALISSLCLGFYDVMKKLSLRDNNVPIVLWLNTVFGAALLSPVIFAHGVEGLASPQWNLVTAHLLIVLKAVIVLGSWVMGYYAIKHLPLTIQGPINATRPVLVLVGALLIFGERLNWLQWVGIILGFASLYLISRIGSKEGFSFRRSLWMWLSIGAMTLGAVSALMDKYLLRQLAPADVLAWYFLYECLIMSVLVSVIRRFSPSAGGRFRWRWTILFISIFLSVADFAYFSALAVPGSMISIVSMIRRGSVIVSFLYGVVVLRERNVRRKAIDLGILLLSLICLVVGSTL